MIMTDPVDICIVRNKWFRFLPTPYIQGRSNIYYLLKQLSLEIIFKINNSFPFKEEEMYSWIRKG